MNLLSTLNKSYFRFCLGAPKQQTAGKEKKKKTLPLLNLNSGWQKIRKINKYII